MILKNTQKVNHFKGEALFLVTGKKLNGEKTKDNVCVFGVFGCVSVCVCGFLFCGATRVVLSSVSVALIIFPSDCMMQTLAHTPPPMVCFPLWV